ncbi:MAG: FHA domain-containing protein [Desertimonas sp.]
MRRQDDLVLLDVSSDAGTARVAVRGPVVRVGRADDNDVVLTNQPTVSRHHAELSVAESGVASVRDLGSHNGTHVNGRALGTDERAEVGPDDVIGLGSVTVRVVLSGETNSMTVEDASAAATHQLLTSLSNREREVLALVAAGRTDDQVAAELFISVKTVHSHLDRIRDKTGLRRRAELTRLAVRLGLSAP